MSSLPKQQVEQLHAFIKLLASKPAMIHDPALGFFREYIESVGGTVPAPPKKEESPKPEQSKAEPPKEETPEPEPEDDPESDVELDMSGVIGKLLLLRQHLAHHPFQSPTTILPSRWVSKATWRCQKTPWTSSTKSGARPCRPFRMEISRKPASCSPRPSC